MKELLKRIAELIEDGITYKEAWSVLYKCFGERLQNEELLLMESVLQSVKLDFKERQDALQDQTTSKV